MPGTKADIITQLRKQILQWEGYKAPAAGAQSLIGLGPVDVVFPNGVFPTAAVHEVVCGSAEKLLPEAVW